MAKALPAIDPRGDGDGGVRQNPGLGRTGLALARRWARRALECLYPPVCRACGRALLGCVDPILCPDCHARMPWLGRAVCPRCGAMTGSPADPGRDCRRCRASPRAFSRAAGVARYLPPARELVLSLKYGGDRMLARSMARAMAARVKTARFPPCDAVLAVPLHMSRRRARGYNQAELLARRLSAELDWPLRTRGFSRVLPTPEQTRLASSARRIFPEGAFRATGDWTGARVLLVDDVLTTGATADACARGLRAAGASEVYVIAFAR